MLEALHDSRVLFRELTLNNNFVQLNDTGYRLPSAELIYKTCILKGSAPRLTNNSEMYHYGRPIYLY